MNKKEIIIYEEEVKNRIDKYLNTKYPELSRTYIQKLILENYISVNNKKVNKNYLLSKNDEISIEIPEPKKSEIQPENLAIEIIYENDDFLIVNKPYMMVVHPANNQNTGTLVNALLYHCKNLSDINGIERPGIVHRLDKDTSGIMIIAKNNHFHKYISNEFKERRVRKTYIAVVHNSFNEKKGIIKLPIGRSKKDRKKMAIVNDGRNAITKYRVIFNSKEFSIVKVRLVTGRTHQIRVHFSYLKHPIINDLIYSNIRKNPLPIKSERLMLHSYSIKFYYPAINDYVYFKTEKLPLEFEKLFGILNLKRKEKENEK
ncbi:MAG TPA: RluA family pseudouridine synthase [bacterium]|nr:RluA family pseudouridine synthase [bacterium]HOL47753.1 RluA family pseudouridine synthase [bacterium]HPQ17705.1 RluA family pseudouridine synthase [bacterium]